MCCHQLEWLAGQSCMGANSTPHSWRHKRACKALLYWYSDKQHALSLKNTLLESSPQKTRSPIFPCPCSRASSSQVQLHLDNRFLGNSNSPLIRTKSDSLGFTSYLYCKFNLENPKPRSQQCFVAPFLCISPMIPFTASDFMLCLSEVQSLNALRASIFRQVCGALLNQSGRQVLKYWTPSEAWVVRLLTFVSDLKFFPPDGAPWHDRKWHFKTYRVLKCWVNGK